MQDPIKFLKVSFLKVLNKTFQETPFSPLPLCVFLPVGKSLDND